MTALSVMASLLFVGTSSALQVLDTLAFMPLGQIIQMFVQQNYIQRKGAYRVCIK